MRKTYIPHKPAAITGPDSKVGQVITYVPQYQQQTEGPDPDMGFARRAVWMYTHKLGQEFSLVLMLSLGYQFLVAIFLGVRAIRGLPLLSWLPGDTAWQAIGFAAALVAGFFVQALIVSEAAQVVWIRRTDRLKVRLMSGSVWWWFHLLVLIVSVILDFLMLFMAITGTTDLGRGWKGAQANQMTFIATILFTVLNLLTLLRCASVMRTSTSEENRREVEEQMRAIADEILLDAGEGTRLAAQQAWKVLGSNPRRFLPLHESVMNLIRDQHPDFFPDQLGGDTWGYDQDGNTFAALPPDVHQALLKGRSQSNRFSDPDQRQMWSLPPSDQARIIDYNLGLYGKPRFVNLADLDNPEFAYTPADFKAFTSGEEVEAGAGVAGLTTATPNAATTLFADKVSFLTALSDLEKVQFAGYLKSSVYPSLHKAEWTEANVPIWNVFDLVDLQYIFKQWKSSRAG